MEEITKTELAIMRRTEYDNFMKNNTNERLDKIFNGKDIAKCYDIQLGSHRKFAFFNTDNEVTDYELLKLGFNIYSTQIRVTPIFMINRHTKEITHYINQSNIIIRKVLDENNGTRLRY